MIQWTDNLSVDIEVFDSQHKELIGMINSFYANIAKGSTNEIILELIDALRDYTIVHFSTEERYMKKYNYPHFDIHKKEHDLFVGKVKDFNERVRSGKILLNLEVTGFIKEWLTNHILVTDKQCGAYLKEIGLV